MSSNTKRRKDEQQPYYSSQQQQPQMQNPSYMQTADNMLGPPEIGPDEIITESILGDGSFGTVYKGRCRQKDVAVKVMLKQVDEKTLKDFRKEVAIMSKIFHPNIVLFLGACTSVPGKLMICTELMRGNLETLLMDHNIKLPLITRMRMSKDAALGVLWLHSSNPVFIHRDLKTSNLLVDSNLTLKVCDFGLSQIKQRGENLKDGQDGAKGTPLWMAPEVLQGKLFNEKADVYSFGLVLWQIYTRKELFPEFDNFYKFVTAICEKQVRPPIPDDCPAALKELIKNCWDPAPEVRPGFSEIVSSLESIIIDCSIPDEYGAIMWKNHFKHIDDAPWKDFVNVFANFVGLTNQNTSTMYDLLCFSPNLVGSTIELNFKCLKAIIVSPPKGVGPQEEEVVSMEQFGKVLAWFGNLRDDGSQILDKIRNLMECAWFHGDISTSESENRLHKKPEGTFLVRFSTSEPGAYTISKVSKNGVISHQRIHRPGGKFQVNNSKYLSVKDLIAGEAQALGISTPCLGSRFLSLIYKSQISGYIN
ncbi:SH2 domain-containing protein [Cavenderia fasciculata]|uniref:non-specific serine/threonine protein kinase n=1 Tax=Cavenderia fasciculata TaxID=261658 RepID=F4Q6H6_CACFS|nr:SH2 domain-containing protein [Cavenderia fasciculata]EGG16486.1 SH2 domain-containing protein [Cavenderia fasciculata]|eukprot:XP_004354886.1 SH2 domain-containing protein [Cavenderia fasciculata]